MKRWFLVLAAAGGAAFWWRRRSGQPMETWQGAADRDSMGGTTSAFVEPKLGGDVAPELLAILACPVDKQPVAHVGNFLVCNTCQRHYPIRDGIPVMLVDEALTAEQAAAAT